MACIARLYYFKGQVQGVGFRYNTEVIAESFPVKGFVRNLPDGRVELQVEGEERTVQAFVQAIQDRFTGCIQNLEFRDIPVQHLGAFEIRF